MGQFRNPMLYPFELRALAISQFNLCGSGVAAPDCLIYICMQTSEHLN